MQLRVVEFSKRCGFRMKKYIALFDARDISEDEIHQLIEEKKVCKDHRVVVIPQEVFCSVFRSLTE